MPASEPSSPSPQSLTTTLLLGLAHAVLLGLSFEPPGLWPLAFLAPAPLALMALRGVGLLRVATIAFSMQLVMWLILNIWVDETYSLSSTSGSLGDALRFGRDFERQITSEYLGQLNELYEKWIAHFSLCPVLTVPSDDLDYVVNSSHLELIGHKVQEKLTGKEEVVFDLEEMT